MRYEVEYRRTPSDGTEDDVAVQWLRVEGGVDAASGSVSILDLEVGVSYDVRVRQVDEESGAISEWSLWPGTIVEREDGTPPNVDQVRLTKSDCLTWDPLMEVVDLRGYLVRHATGADECWERAEAAHEAYVDGPPFLLCRVPKGRRTFLVKAVDWDGNESATAAMLVADRGLVDDQAEFSVRTELQTPGFPGTKSGGAVDVVVLKAEQDTTPSGDGPMFGCGGDPWLPIDGSAPMISFDPEASFFGDVWGGDARWLGRAGTERFFSEVIYRWMEYVWEFEVHCGEEGPRSVLTADIAVRAVSGLYEVPWRLQYRVKSSATFIPADPFGVFISASGSAEFIPTEVPRRWRPWPGRLLGAAPGVYEFRLLVPGGHERAEVTACSVTASSEPRVRHVTGLVVPALGGTRVTPGEPWRRVLVARVTPVSAAEPTTLHVVDKAASKGPAIEAYQDGVLVAAVVDAELRGY